MKKYQRFIVVFILVFVYFNIKSQNFQWANGIGSSGNDACKSIAVDSDGNVYMTGYFFDFADFDPGAGVVNVTSKGDRDIFIAKYDSDGNIIWAKNIGSQGYDESNCITLDIGGNIYITGSFTDTVDFDPGPSTATLISTPLYQDIFFAKYDSDGNYLWVKVVGGSYYNDSGNKIIVDSLGNCYLTGKFTQTTDFDPGQGVYNLVSNGAKDAFLAKYSNNGDFDWAFKIGGDYPDEAHGLAIDKQNNIYITGEFVHTVDFDPGPGTANLIANQNSDEDIFFAKYDSSGDFIWAKKIGSNYIEQANNIVVSDSGNIYLTGYFGSWMNFDPNFGSQYLSPLGGWDCFFAKYDSSGNYIWAKNFGSSEIDISNDITLDKFENVYMTGGFNGTCDFDPDPQSLKTISSVGSSDIFFAKYDKSGKFIFAKSIGSIGDESGMSIRLRPNDSEIFVSGYFSSIADFDINSDTFNVYPTGGFDIFIAKYDTLSVSIINDSFVNNSFIIYPNPSKGKINFQLPNNSSQYTISLHNILGEVIWISKAKQDEIDLSNSPIGIYSILVTTQHKTYCKKIIIQ